MSIKSKLAGISMLATTIGVVPAVRAESSVGQGEDANTISIESAKGFKLTDNVVVSTDELPWVLSEIANKPDSIQNKEFSLHIQVKARPEISELPATLPLIPGR